MSAPWKDQTGSGVIAFTSDGKVLLSHGTSAPADTTTGHAGGAIFLDTDTGTIYVNEATTDSSDYNRIAVGELDLSGLTATAAEINASSDVSARVVNVTDAATYTVLAANSGKPHVFPDLTQSCTLALPAVSSGLEYVFIGKGVAADASSWIFQSASATNFFLGGVGFIDTDDPADTVVAVYSNGSSNDFLTVAAPGAGTRIHLLCDGTNWIANGIVVGATAPAFSDT